MLGERQLTLLGNPRLEKAGAPVTGIAHRKSLALLAYLAVTGRAHSRDVLAGLLLGRATQPLVGEKGIGPSQRNWGRPILSCVPV